MNPIEQLINFLNVLLACTAMATTEQTISGRDFLVQHWQCKTTNAVTHIDGWRV